MTDATTYFLIRQLERRLIDPTVRACPDALADLVADDFTEFASSGSVYDKATAVSMLQRRPQFALSIADDFTIKRLAFDVILATYCVVTDDNLQELHSRRSSIWRRADGRWRVVFHQSTALG